MRNPRPLFLALLLLFGGAGGFVFARRDTLFRSPAPAKPIPGTEAAPSDTMPATPAAKLAQRLAAALAEIEAATSGDTLRELWEACGPDAYGEACRRLLLARWAEVDPEGGFAYFLTQTDQSGLRAFALEWALRDASVFAERAAKEKRKDLYYALGDSLARLAPERYLEFIAAWNHASGSDLDAYHMEIAFSRLYADHPERALALLDSVTGKGRVDAFSGLGSAMAERDGTGARRWAEGLEDIADREAALGGIARAVGKNDPHAAAAILKQIRDPLVQGGPGSRLLRDLIRKDPSVAIAWVTEHFQESIMTGNWVSMVLVQSLWAADERTVIDAIARTPDEGLRGSMIQGLKGYTNSNDIGEMLATANDLDSPETRNQLRRALLQPLAQATPAVALRYLESLPPDEATPELWEAYVNGAGRADDPFGPTWDMLDKLAPERQILAMESRLFQAASRDITSALEKLETLRDHPAYAQLTGSVTDQWARQDPAAAMNWIQSLPPEAIPIAAESFADGVGADFAPQALAWLQSLPLSGEQLQEACSEVARTWMERDGIAASALIRELPPGAARQGTIIGLVDALSRTDPAAALEWAEEINPASGRDYYEGQATRFQHEFGRRNAQ